MLQTDRATASPVTPDLVLAYRDALAQTRRLQEPRRRPTPPASAPAARAPVHPDVRIHQAGRIASVVACLTAAGALFAATEVLTQWLRYGI